MIFATRKICLLEAIWFFCSKSFVGESDDVFKGGQEAVNEARGDAVITSFVEKY